MEDSILDEPHVAGCWLQKRQFVCERTFECSLAPPVRRLDRGQRPIRVRRRAASRGRASGRPEDRVHPGRARRTRAPIRRQNPARRSPADHPIEHRTSLPPLLAAVSVVREDALAVTARGSSRNAPDRRGVALRRSVRGRVGTQVLSPAGRRTVDSARVRKSRNGAAADQTASKPYTPSAAMAQADERMRVSRRLTALSQLALFSSNHWSEETRQVTPADLYKVEAFVTVVGRPRLRSRRRVMDGLSGVTPTASWTRPAERRPLPPRHMPSRR